MADASFSDATPATKRRRVDGTDETQAPTGPSEKYKDLWLEDGNIVIRCAEGAFRVHRSLLAAQSEVFRDMFTLPIPATGVNDALPTVQLSDDTEQMYRFLCCLILHKNPPKTSKEYLGQILDLFELSRKYIVPVIRTVCIDILKELFPSTLETYQHTIQKRRDLVSFRASLRCVVVAVTDGLPTLLPACYLYIAGDYYSEMMDLKMASSWPSEIPLTYYATIVRSMRELIQVKDIITDSFSDNWTDGWGMRDHEHQHQIAQLLTYYRGPNNAGFYPAEDLTLFDPNWMATDVVAGRGIDDLCDECIARWDGEQRKSWVTAWERLPEFLLLDSWAAIRAQESQASSTVTV